MKEQKDAILRSKRLAKCRDLSKRTVSMQYITTEDLLIYTRWLICHLHSVKHIHSFIRVRYNNILNIYLITFFLICSMWCVQKQRVKTTCFSLYQNSINYFNYLQNYNKTAQYRGLTKTKRIEKLGYKGLAM